jgi:hypothetical protein
MLKRLSVIWFKRKGWRFIGSLPKGKRHVVFVAGPHTGFRDFVIATAIQSLTRFDVRIAVDQKYWKWYSEAVLRQLNAVKLPLNDTNYSKEKLERRLKERDHSYLVLTFNRLGDLSTDGQPLFYDLVKETGAELVLIALDHRRKVVKFHTPFYLSGHRERDMSYIRSFFTNYFSFYQRHLRTGRER